MAFSTREDFAAKVEWEGGVLESLDYGLTKEDVPEGDTELYAAWEALEIAYSKVPEARHAVYLLLEECL